MTAVPIYGTLAVSTWKKMRWAAVICLICLLLTAFSRNYLGVHTPQDVLVGILAGSMVVWGMYVLFRWLESIRIRKTGSCWAVFSSVSARLCIFP